MNDPELLVAVGFLLTAFTMMGYIRWRRSPRGKTSAARAASLGRYLAKPGSARGQSGAATGDPAAAAFFSGAARRPPDEIQRMFGVWILLGVLLVCLSLFLRSEIPEDRPRWIAYFFLSAGLLMAAGGNYWGDHLDRASNAERITALLAEVLRRDLLQITCLAAGPQLLILAAAAGALCGWDAAGVVMAISLTAGIILMVIGVGLPRWNRLDASGNSVEKD
ncbi:MAG: hypothetical protein WBM17_08210 [Anaerolineales bacterium]